MIIFGYGSIIWKQGFEYEECMKGYIQGFQRRFWHGSEDHRGTPNAPGRVVSVTYSDDPEEKVWGVAFKIHQKHAATARESLIIRETGYDIIKTTFYPHDADLEPFEVELFIATTSTPLFLGPAPTEEIAWQIYHSKGKSGPNLEYLMKLIWHYRELFPHQKDAHLDELEYEIYKIANLKGHVINIFTFVYPELHRSG